MDTISAVKLARKIFWFLHAASETLGILEDPTKPDNPAALQPYIDSSAEHLRLRTNELDFQILDGVSLLSEEDELICRLCEQCKKVSRELLDHLATCNVGSNGILVN